MNGGERDIRIGWPQKRRGVAIEGTNSQERLLNDYYYDLADETAAAWKWQAELAAQFGVYGFCIYQYWFTGVQTLQKPMEILLRHPEIPLRYSICWANEEWARSWYGNDREVLIPQEYGGGD